MRPIALLLCVSLSAAAATPSPADLARCAEIAAPDARLACYDKLSGSAGRAATTAPAAPAPPAANAPPAAIAPPAAGAPPAANVPPAPATVAAPTAPATDAKNFGLSEVQIRPVPQGPTAIQARVAKLVNTRYGSNYVVLDNGQTWAYTDSDLDERLIPGDQVTIKRATLGSFLMKTPSKNSYHVRRTQ